MWRLDDIPDLAGRTAIVTGGNVGLGFRSALELARRGAEVVLGCRRPDSADEAVSRIRAELPGARVSSLQLDLVDFDSIAAFASLFLEDHNRLDILMNNAGVVNLETLQRTPDGREMHMATNHDGHFALTAHLFPMLCATPGARVVTLTSGAYRMGEIRFDDMDWRQRQYSRVRSYGDSKLANLLLMRSLQMKFERAGVTAISVAAHPGLTGTERQQESGIGGRLARWAASPLSVGVAPQLRAATDPTVMGGDFLGPKFTVRGAPVKQAIKGAAADDDLARRLWAHAEQATGCRYDSLN